MGDNPLESSDPEKDFGAIVDELLSMELIEELPDDSSPSAVLAHSLAAVGYLCTMKPALEPALETHLLRAALHSVFTLGTEKDTTGIQALHKVIPEVLDAMLGNLLAESPDTDRLHFILEHVNLWVVSRVSQERARAIRSSTALLRYTVTLPEFDISAEFPRMGHHVAQLALFVSEPDKEISLTIHDAEDLWCYDWHQDSRLLGYKNTARVGEHEDVTAKVMGQLHIIRHLHQVPEVLQGLWLI
ncbi:maestro heat-like repeat-containing protein family member 1 [Chelonia mydas]|uniref:maestro heat-like repeat-containing protein family member 1 n=1 Tax=Chelonia mydas TaxID=8469 RepID=UPI001CA91375|nr:maestro heat-like repeat-containing protein family member 1 [Chelonia mydas]